MLIFLTLIGCGEPAYYPNLAVAVDTGFDPVTLQCGVVGTDVLQSVEVFNPSSVTRSLFAVDDACTETPLLDVPGNTSLFVTIVASDALSAYQRTPEGDTFLVAVRGPLPGQTTSGWVLP